MRNTTILFFFIMLAFTISCGKNKDDKTTKSSVETTNEMSQTDENQLDEDTKKTGDKIMVLISTNMGDIKLELDKENAPITVDNFISYLEGGFYDNTIFHRVIPNFMIQGGGFNEDMSQKTTKDPIKNEADNGLSNDRGTIAMARTSVVDSATSQFFINLNDNSFLNHGARDFGYAVFGKVIEGMDVVEKIGTVKTGSVGPYRDVPTEAVVIKSITKVDG